MEIRLVDSLTAPVEPGAQAGKAILTVNGEGVVSVPLILREGAPPLTFDWFLRQVMGAYLTA